MYKITLRTLHELFEADKAEALEVIVFNGWVNTTNKATGKKDKRCIVTIKARKNDFKEIEISNIDEKECFKNFKGISKGKLINLTHVEPIPLINENKK